MTLNISDRNKLLSDPQIEPEQHEVALKALESMTVEILFRESGPLKSDTDPIIVNHACAITDISLSQKRPFAFLLCCIVGEALAHLVNPAAIPYLEKSVLLYDEKFPHADSPEMVGNSLEILGAIKHAQGDRDAATAHFARALAIYSENMGPDHYRTVQCRIKVRQVLEGEAPL